MHSRSLSHLVTWPGDEYEIKILTQKHMLALGQLFFCQTCICPLVGACRLTHRPTGGSTPAKSLLENEKNNSEHRQSFQGGVILQKSDPPEAAPLVKSLLEIARSFGNVASNENLREKCRFYPHLNVSTQVWLRLLPPLPTESVISETLVRVV